VEDFLKDRPTLSAQEAAVMPSASVAPAAPLQSAFAQIRRETPRPAPVVQAPLPTAAEPQQVAGEHGTRVQTVVERGRVTKIIVTCACGKTTEIACNY
jgi:hypothetical protein